MRTETDLRMGIQRLSNAVEYLNRVNGNLVASLEMQGNIACAIIFDLGRGIEPMKVEELEKIYAESVRPGNTPDIPRIVSP